jgi:hypothetical protein
MSANKMNAKKVLGFLLCTPAFTKRNITSLLLVGAFFFVYILAGGKIDTELPKARNVSSFGGADVTPGSGMDSYGATTTKDADGSEEKKDIVPQKVLGEVPTSDRRARETASHMKGRIFVDEDADREAADEIDKSGLIKGSYKSPESFHDKRAIERSERRKPDPLSAIEERLGKSR